MEHTKDDILLHFIAVSKQKTNLIESMERTINAIAERTISLEMEIDRLNGIIYQKELDNGEV